MACRYPGAGSPAELWENVVSQRREFRAVPPERLNLADYAPGEVLDADSIYLREAALLEGYEFDRVRFRVGLASFQAADHAHWLALDTAAQALADAGLPDAEGLPRDDTGVVVGNTLTGEFSRAQQMRLRWPYVRRQVTALLAAEGLDAERAGRMLARLEEAYKEPFPASTEESLAGGLANTIAGRISNHFDLHGGGYTVDGACSSSLLATAQACTALAAGDLDAALIGGVDLSLDPFELVGFARTGALAKGEMRIYDRRSGGFLPGEGCGFAVLMREEDARARGMRIYALIRGWGISSDGSGGLTRPEVEGQLMAVGRAYRRAGFGIDSVPLIEGHGTGTPVGDATELAMLNRARREAAERGGDPAAVTGASRAAVGSIKANIGHTKAAAGVASLLKACLALSHQVLPPTTGCDDPHPEIAGEGSTLRVLRQPELWPADRPLRAGVSAMGFGGINSHIVLEGALEGAAPNGAASTATRRRSFTAVEESLGRSRQDGELITLAGRDLNDLARQVERILDRARQLSRSELIDLAAELARAPLGRGPARAAVAASTPAELRERLTTLAGWLAEDEPFRSAAAGAGEEAGDGSRSGFRHGGKVPIFLGVGTPGRGNGAPRVGLLFPGQGSPSHPDGGLWSRRFPEAAAVYRGFPLPRLGEEVPPSDTRLAQPAISRASLAGLAVLERLGVDAVAAAGHSLGEITALAWAGAFDEASLARVTTARGQAMADLAAPSGTMANLGAGADEVRQLIAELTAESPRARGFKDLVVTGINAPTNTVIAGPEPAVEAAVERAAARGWSTARLAVSHAFHSPLVAAAGPGLARALEEERPRALQRPVASTVTGGWLRPGGDEAQGDALAAMLVEQITLPVRFIEAVKNLAAEVDVLVEVGPGHVLTSLARRILGEGTQGGREVPAFALDAGSESVSGLLAAAGALHALGAPIDPRALFEGRFTRPFHLDRPSSFLINPCELAPKLEEGRLPRPLAATEAEPATAGTVIGTAAGTEGAGASPIGDPAGEAPAHAVDGLAADAAASSPRELVFELLTTKTELPREALNERDRLLSDLHLSSIAVGELVTQASRRLGLPAPAAPTEYANAEIGEVIEALETRLATRGDEPCEVADPAPAGVASWVRPFFMEQVERPLPARDPMAAAPPSGSGEPWQVFAPRPGGKAAPFTRALEGVLATLPLPGAAGVAVVLAERLEDGTPGEETLPELLTAAGRVALEERRPFVLLTESGAGAAFARTLHLEAAGLPVAVLHMPLPGSTAEREGSEAVETTLARVAAELGHLFLKGGPHYFHEARYEVRPDLAPRRTQPVLRSLKVEPRADGAEAPLGHGDVLLVSGGGKGIGAESALALARRWGVKLALLGRSLPEDSPELAANFERFRSHGARFAYRAVDVTDPGAVAAAVAELEEELGAVTGLLHSAGANRPTLIPGLTPEAFRRTLAPKVAGFDNLLAAVDTEKLRLLVGFGSIIGQAGMPGEADYAVANELLRGRIDAFAAAHPECRCRTLEWSVWSGIGMGARLSDLDALARGGITPIPPEVGIEHLVELVEADDVPVAVLVSGRYGTPPTVEVEAGEIPLLRFLENPRVFVPGVELVVDVHLSGGNDPYLAEHVYDGERLFPAVLGLEAMAQAARALVPEAGDAGHTSFSDVRFDRPVTAPEAEGTTLRVAALRENGPEGPRVSVVLRSERTAYALDHFRATVTFPAGSTEEHLEGIRPPVDAPAAPESSHLPLGRDDLYGPVLFQGGRFQRISGYRSLSATSCLAEIGPPAGRGAWFGAYLPQEMLLGDPGARDASIHGIQACIPHSIVLPVGVERLTVARPPRPGNGAEEVPLPGGYLMAAEERSQKGRELVYDLTVWTAEGRFVERWEGLALRIMGDPQRAPVLASPLLGPYLERRLRDLMPLAALHVAVARRGGADRKARSDRAAAEALGRPITLVRRPDGKPEVAGEGTGAPTVSIAHAGELVLAVAGAGGHGCDVEAVKPRERDVWSDLLGAWGPMAEMLSRETGEDLDRSATRLWTVAESLKKSGSLPGEPLTLAGPPTADGWALFRAGRRLAATVLLDCPETGEPLSFAVIGPEGEGVMQPDSTLDSAPGSPGRTH